MEGGDPIVIANQEGSRTTPSVVAFTDKGERVVGQIAKRQAITNSENTIFSIKRLMGRVYGEPRVSEVQQRFRYRLADAPPQGAQDQGVRVLLNGQPYTPVQVSSMILRQVKAGAELALGEEVTHAVITVPAYFEERQRKATIEAGEVAGLKVLEIIDEPTAASIAFGAGKEKERHRVLVYDLGGGTFDISIVQMTAGQYSVLDASGNNWLGGDDFDQTIVARMIEWVKQEYDGYDPTPDVAFLIKAKIEAERAKIALSAQQRYTISAPLMLKVPHVGSHVDLELEITREQFEQDIRPSVDETMQIVRRTLERQHLTPEDITEVLLVGGSTAVPLVQQEMFALFGQFRVKRHVNPMDCVALGAGILASSRPLAGESQDRPAGGKGPRVQGVTPMHLGIAAVRGDNPDAFVPIIPKGTPYPLLEPMKHTFRPSEENQTLIRVPVYEGLSERASLNEQQGVIEFPLPEGLGMSSAVEVSFNYDSSRLLTVGIRVIGTDHRYTETLKRDRPRAPAPGQPQNLVDDWREELQPSLKAASHFLETYGEYMTPEDRQETQDAMKKGEEALRQRDPVAGQQAILELRSKVLGSGTASLLFIAERAMHGVNPETSQLLAYAVASLRAAHRRGNETDVARLSSELRTVVAQIVSKQMAVPGVEDRKDWEDLLRDIEG